MKTCPFCAEEIQTEAIKCRYCGEFLDGGRPAFAARAGYEYRSTTEIGGLPLIHIAHGIDPVTGTPRVARGIIAIGNIAIGGIALGGFSLGGIALGGCSVGLLSFGGLAVGAIALGGVSAAYYLAAGGIALSLNYAIGGMPIAPHTLGPHGIDPGMRAFLDDWLARLRR